ncbi:MAG: hypothetical protein KJ060_19590 [Candidatus Hydrogenedentes bacterium]|nr:hypothetical protein [Candidatus Hydrogenedentota bacterium]
MSSQGEHFELSRRAFMQASALTAGGVALTAAAAGKSVQGDTMARNKSAVVYTGFVYPPTSQLDAAGYYSWPGSGFNAEGQQRDYTAKFQKLATDLNMTVDVRPGHVDTEADAAQFAEQAAAAKPDGILLVLFKKGHWNRVLQIVDSAPCPVVVFAPLGVLLVDHIREVQDRPGVYLINSGDFGAVERALVMVRTTAWMRQSRIINIDGDSEKQTFVPRIGTEILNVPHQRFYDVYANTEVTEPVRKLADAYRNGAKDIVEPNEQDIVDAARAYHALHQLVIDEKADALMMNCLPGLQMPHKHVPPCMGFMTLRDMGIPAGCQSDLNPTLTLLLVQYLYNRPGFQQNASMDTANNLYFGAHCTSPSCMNGPGTKAEPYILRSHAEAGWGCVPRVLFPRDQEVTLAQYFSGDAPEMIVYTGTIVDCPEIPPTGGCRTNLRMTINEVEDVRNVQGMHQIIFYGNHGKDLRTYCQLNSIGLRV